LLWETPAACESRMCWQEAILKEKPVLLTLGSKWLCHGTSHDVVWRLMVSWPWLLLLVLCAEVWLRFGEVAASIFMVEESWRLTKCFFETLICIYQTARGPV
jgi:hypothetical protein